MAYAPTTLSDVLKPTPVSEYVAAALPDLVSFMSSGAATMELTALASMGGNTMTLRHFAEDTTAPVLDDGSAADGAVVASYADVAVVTRRRRNRAIDSAIRGALGRNDPDAVNREVGRQSAYFWAKAIEKSLVSIVAAVADASSGVLRSTHRHTIGTAAATTAANASLNAIIDTALLQGDNMEKLALLIVPSKVWADLKKEQGAKIDYQIITGPDGASIVDENGVPMRARFYDGKRVIISDQVPTYTATSKVYRTILCKPGTFALGFQKDLETRPFFDGTKNSDVIVQSAAYAAHLPGVKWTGTAGSIAGPTDAELATATNWSKVATNDKEIGLAILESN